MNWRPMGTDRRQTKSGARGFAGQVAQTGSSGMLETLKLWLQHSHGYER